MRIRNTVINTVLYNVLEVLFCINSDMWCCSEVCQTPSFSPAATLLRMKRRKRQLAAPSCPATDPEQTESRASPPLHR